MVGKIKQLYVLVDYSIVVHVPETQEKKNKISKTKNKKNLV